MRAPTRDPAGSESTGASRPNLLGTGALLSQSSGTQPAFSMNCEVSCQPPGHGLGNANETST